MQMKLSLSVLCALSLVACGSSDSGSTDSPIASTPLSGTIDGQRFDATIALVRADFGAAGTRSVSIYDKDVSCNDTNVKADRFILLSVPWKSGTTRSFGLSLTSADNQTATFVIDRNGTPDNVVSTEGRVEVVAAPVDVGSTGTIRLRAKAEGHSVEGEVVARVCE
jgi:hypothetical protein